MAEPISMDDARAHLRVDGGADASLIQGNIVAAREWAEDYTGLILTRREITESIDRLSAQTRLRAWPVVADEPVALTFRGRDGEEQVISGATVRASTRPATLYPAPGAQWPAPSGIVGAIEAMFTAGFGDPADIPATVRQAMLVMLTAFYDGREGEGFDVAETAAKRLCSRHKRRIL